MKDIETSCFLLESIVDSFIDDFMCGNGLADSFRLVGIYGIIRYSYILEIISRIERDDLFKKLFDIVGNSFDDNICDPFDFSL